MLLKWIRIISGECAHSSVRQLKKFGTKILTIFGDIRFVSLRSLSPLRLCRNDVSDDGVELRLHVVRILEQHVEV